MKVLFFVLIILVLSCNEGDKSVNGLTKNQFLKTNNIDSLVFDRKSNTYFDKYGDGSGSVYKFNNSDVLSFYCFLNGKVYPYSMHFDEKGKFVKAEGNSSVRNQYEVNSDSSYTFYFFYSTFLKTDYQIQSIFNVTDTIDNVLLPVSHFTNVGGFSIVVRTKKDVITGTVVNQVRYFDNVRRENDSFIDTIKLKDIIQVPGSSAPVVLSVPSLFPGRVFFRFHK